MVAVVFAGTERVFSAGVDIPAHEEPMVRMMLGKFHAVIRAMVASKKLLIASVRRHCLGGGAELALDMRHGSTPPTMRCSRFRRSNSPRFLQSHGRTSRLRRTKARSGIDTYRALDHRQRGAGNGPGETESPTIPRRWSRRRWRGCSK